MRPHLLSLLAGFTIAVSSGALVLLIVQPWRSDPLAVTSQVEPAFSDPAISPRWLRELNLTRQQVRELQRIRRQNQATLSNYSQELTQARRQLRDLLSSEASDAELQRHFERTQALSQEAEQLRFEAMLSMRNVLTPAQRQILQTRLQTRRDRRPE